MRNKQTARKTKQKELDRTIIAEMTLKGYNQFQIADVVGISREQVSRDMKKVREDWADRRDKATTEHIANELAKLDLIEAQAWAEFETSKKEKEVKFKELKDPDNPEKGSRISIRKETQTGNPAYLNTIQGCMKKRAELLGLDAPKKIDNNNTNSTQLSYVDGLKKVGDQLRSNPELLEKIETGLDDA